MVFRIRKHTSGEIRIKKAAKFLILLSILAGLKAQAATDSDTLYLEGTVAEVTTLTVTAKAAATTLDIINGESGLSVGTADEESNSLNGYRIKMYSDNNGFLEKGDDTSVKTAYQISYGSVGALTPGTQAAPVTVLTEAGTGSKITNTRDIKVDVTAFPGALVGAYSDTVTFVIEGL